MTRLQRSIGLWLATIAVALAALAGAPAALADSSDVVAADVALRLADDGDLLVTETLEFDYNGTFEGSYRDIALLHGETISEVRFSEDGEPYDPGGNTILGSSDRPGVYGVQQFADLTRIVWHFRATNERRRFEISYRVTKGAVAYDDVIDIGWAVWGEDWDFDLDRLTATFTDPALDPDDSAYRVWGHPREVEGETVRGAGKATLEAENVAGNTAVEFRISVPRQSGQDVSGMRVRQGDGLDAILAEEQALDEDFNTPFNKLKRWVAHNVILVSLLIGALAALILFLLTVLARERETAAPDHLAEPPDDAGPALAYGLAHEGGDSADTVLATLLDLVERGYYESEQQSTEEEKLDLALRVSEDRPPADALISAEREVLAFFDELLDGKTIALSEMRGKIPKHSAKWRTRWEAMTSELNEVEAGAISWDRDLRKYRVMLVLVVLALFVLVTLASLDVERKWLAPSLIGVGTLIGLVAVPSTKLKRISAEHGERCASWRAFERWTEDFPRLADDPPATLELWKRILVYGVAFGTAERMIASGRIPEPVIAASSSASPWTAYALSGSFHDNSFDGSAFSSGFASQVAPQSSSSGGGGGFSGGGGGFSGGGGGGSW